MVLQTHITLAVRSRTTPSTLNATVTNTEDITKCYAQHGRFSGQRKTVTESLSRTVQFKQAQTSNAVISGMMLTEKALCIATRLGNVDLKASVVGSVASGSDKLSCKMEGGIWETGR